MKISKPFLLTLLATALAILASLPGLACRPRPATNRPAFSDALPVDEGATVSTAPGAASTLQDQTDTTLPGRTFRFERISLEEGLSQSTVYVILQDQQGFMWFGTQDGLNKYDGYQFTVYKHDAGDPTTLVDNFVRTIYEDQNQVLWVGTRSGLDRIDRVNGTFIHYQHQPNDPGSLSGTDVSSIYEDRAGMLWIGTTDGGLSQLDGATNTFTHYHHDPHDPKTLTNNSVHAIYEDQSGKLWVGTDGGLGCFDRTTGTFAHYPHRPNDPTSLSDNRVRAIFEDRQGTLWIGTDGGGLNQLVLSKVEGETEGLDRPAGTFIHYRHDPNNPHSLSGNRVRAISEDRAGRLWIGTRNGLDQLVRSDANDPSQGQDHFIHYQHDPYDPQSLSADSIFSIYEDRSGVLWIGTGVGGLSKYSPAANQFILYQHRPDLPNSLSDDIVWAIFEDQSGILWIGTFNGGLNRLDRSSGTFVVYQHDPADLTSLSSNDVRAVLMDRDGVLWVGTDGGLDQFDPKTETFIHYRHDPSDPDSLSDDRVRAIYEDRRGNLWIGTESGGLERLDRASKTFAHYRHDPDDPFSLSDNHVWAIYEDQDGVLWVGTQGGINLWDGVNDRFDHYMHDPDDPQSLSNDAVLSLYEDPMGTVWVGTWGGGLNYFDRVTQTFAHYTEKGGLPNDTVYGILADAAGFLWLSTNNGLSKFDPHTETFQNYDVSDGLQSNEFDAGAYFQSSSGEMFFGGVGGFNAFVPEQIKPNPHIPPIVITAFSQFNQVVRTDLPADEHMQLSYQNNFISFEFAALDYNASDKNQYAYKMEGLDQDWVYAGTRRHADYPNLRPGDYVFRVKGSNNDGIWNEEGIAIHIMVTPPFWERWWFRGLIGLALIGSAIGTYRWRVRNVETRSRELENQVQERTVEIAQRSQELEALYRADEHLYRYLRLDQVFQALVDVAVDILQADKSSLMVWDERQEKMVVQASRGFSAETLAQMSFASGEGMVGTVVTTGEPAIVQDTHTDTRVATRITEPEGIRSFMHVPIKLGDQLFGVFNIDYVQPRAFGGDEQRLFTALAQRAALAIQNAQLYEHSQELAVVEERQRLARDLHDAVTQTLFSASLIAEVLPLLWERNPTEGRKRLEELRELTRGALAEMRTLLLELRPAALVEARLEGLLRQLAESITGRARVPVVVKVEGECELSPEVKVALYRVAQEALNNVAKHSGASQASVSLQCQLARVVLQVSDDGCGFDPQAISPPSLGLSIMRERAEAIGAELRVESQAGHGTQVTVVWKKTKDR